VQEVGHARAGNGLRAGGLYPNDPGVRAAAERAFAEIRSPGC
jgi:hypothetical protein